MANKTLKDWSRIDWHHETTTDNYPGDNNVQLGAILRIADATEAMARSYTTLLEEREMYKRWYKEGNARVDQLNRRIRSLKGVITKLKKK